MQAIEFEAQVQEGMIRLPEPYRHWRENRCVKVILLADDQESPHPAASSLLSGEAALQKVREIGFIGSFEAEPDCSVRYKEMIDWSSKA